MKAVKHIHDSLLSLSYGLETSDTTFAVPEAGFGALSKLINGIAQALEESASKKSDSFNAAKKEFNHIFELLHHDQALGLWTSVFRQFTEVGQNIILATASMQWDQLLDYLRHITEPEFEVDATLDHVLNILECCNSSLKDLLREHLLNSAAFWDPDVLARVPLSNNCVELGLIHDAALRGRNLALRPEAMAAIGPRSEEHGCPTCDGHGAEPQPPEVVSGATSDYVDDDEFLKFPGAFDDIPLVPIVDTGGGCNLIKTEWLRAHGLEHKIDRNPQRGQVLLMADGSTSKNLPVIDVKWSFDGRNKVWTNVEFTVVDDYAHEALIGLPFLKHTETIHTSGGKMVFPEFKGVHTKKEAIPLYNFGTTTGRK
ncbi:hypothetical protein FN846DRAFT_974290 [Sphaerosporella brunnea]|uniref:Uncharacterized protein n=1 Tax=Sphaerosporella brunnea TaxID=1250544 RepID=A0A5J5EHC7_9PEZI|nr:hypothetical protein FN846DRAFT_1025109 [Sphaerosporella brunnea]KAA8894369.1 hypothetical protein FN846DRAFT_974290 [Sphaerosporella brunnea]